MLFERCWRAVCCNEVASARLKLMGAEVCKIYCSHVDMHAIYYNFLVTLIVFCWFLSST